MSPQIAGKQARDKGDPNLKRDHMEMETSHHTHNRDRSLFRFAMIQKMMLRYVRDRKETGDEGIRFGFL